MAINSHQVIRLVGMCEPHWNPIKADLLRGRKNNVSKAYIIFTVTDSEGEQGLCLVCLQKNKLPTLLRSSYYKSGLQIGMKCLRLNGSFDIQVGVR